MLSWLGCAGGVVHAIRFFVAGEGRLSPVVEGTGSAAAVGGTGTAVAVGGGIVAST